MIHSYCAPVSCINLTSLVTAVGSVLFFSSFKLLGFYFTFADSLSVSGWFSTISLSSMTPVLIFTVFSCSHPLPNDAYLSKLTIYCPVSTFGLCFSIHASDSYKLIAISAPVLYGSSAKKLSFKLSSFLVVTPFFCGFTSSNDSFISLWYFIRAS